MSTREVPVIRKALGKALHRRTLFVEFQETVQCTGTYWDGGSRYSYHHLTPKGKFEQIPCPTAPPQHGGDDAPTEAVRPGQAIVQLGTFCGKPSFPTVYIRAEDAEVWGVQGALA
jgi:hypothetical protein